MTMSSVRDIQVLGPESSGLSIQPLSSRKHDIYCYKISLREPDSYLVAELCKHHVKHEYLLVKGHVFLSDFQDYKRCLLLFEKNISQVAGPVTPEHLSILLSDQYCVVRPYAWYRQYDAKVELYSYKVPRSEFLDMVQNLISNIDSLHKVMSMGFRASAIYTQVDQAELLVALSKLYYPQGRIRSITSRCVIWNP